VILRRPTWADRHAFLAMARASRDLHRGWVEPAGTLARYAAYLHRLRRPAHAGFLALRADDGALVGVVNLAEIVRGSFECAYLGYYGNARLAGQGYMREAVALALDQAFGPLGLHRIEANGQPANRRSVALVESLGFRREGFSPRYLKVAGRWRDHDRFALLREDWPGSARALARAAAPATSRARPGAPKRPPCPVPVALPARGSR
jgi:ribosomal-protein-alanine N-acetyltransferase